ERGVGVVACLGGQIEGDRQPGLTLAEVLAVELVRGFGRRMARISAEHPGFVALDLYLSAHGGGKPIFLDSTQKSTPSVSGQPLRCAAHAWWHPHWQRDFPRIGRVKRPVRGMPGILSALDGLTPSSG